MIPLSVSDITQAAKDIAELYPSIAEHLKERRMRTAVAEAYDEMLRNPRFPYRSTRSFGKLIGDRSPDYAGAHAFLVALFPAGVRGSLGEKEMWIRDGNWLLDEQGKVVRDAAGHGVLQPDVRPGTR